MRRRIWRVVELLLVPTIGLAIALAVAPSRATLEVHVWLLVVLGLALLALIALVRNAYPHTPSPFEAHLRHPHAPAERPAGLQRLEREVSMAGGSAFDLHVRLRPSLADLAGELLASRRGIDLSRDAGRARAVLGNEAWELVRPDRGPPSERHAPGIDALELDRVVTALE